MGYWSWKPHVPVAKRREQAERAAQKAQKAGQDFAPVRLASRTIAKTFWGKAWCDNLEAYSDFGNRLPRGRTYVRSGAVIDLKVEPGRVIAQVVGSSIYRIEIGIAALSARAWKALVADCTGSIATLIELLQGKFSQAVMMRLCEPKTGLFPAPAEIRFDCSCPDWATMCKHVAAALYGVGARLDEKPELLFILRQVDPNDLLAAQAAELPARVKRPAKAKVLDDSALADVFGIEMAAAEVPANETPRKRRAPVPAKATKAAKAAAEPRSKSSAGSAKKPAGKSGAGSGRSAAKSATGKAAKKSAKKSGERSVSAAVRKSPKKSIPASAVRKTPAPKKKAAASQATAVRRRTGS